MSEDVEEIKENISTPMNSILQKRFRSKNNDSPLGILPSTSTPPSQNLRIENPFEKRLFDSLHTHFMSPTVFIKTCTPKSEKFKWTIDDIATLKPADIDESSVEQHYASEHDYSKELAIQEKIDRFFSLNEIIPSPHPPKKKVLNIDATPKRDCETQTMLSLPVILPEKLEMLLKPYFMVENSKEKNLYEKLFAVHDSGDSSPPTPIFSPVNGSPIIFKSNTHRSIDSSSPLSLNLGDIANDLCVAKVPDCGPLEVSLESINEEMTCPQSSVKLERDIEDNIVEMDVSNSNTPRSKLFSSQRKKLSNSFLMEYEQDDFSSNNHIEDGGYYSNTCILMEEMDNAIGESCPASFNLF